jgi:hypothetical protein
MLKLDVQGAEKPALMGARSVLEDTHVIICEADIDDFQEINDVITSAGFFLYDITTLMRIADGTLGWFYPVYLHNKLSHLRAQSFWETKDNDTVINMQITRREQILKSNAEKLNRLRHRGAEVGRNDLCPCGSGRKFKHCCGTYKA